MFRSPWSLHIIPKKDKKSDLPDSLGVPQPSEPKFLSLVLSACMEQRRPRPRRVLGQARRGTSGSAAEKLRQNI